MTQLDDLTAALADEDTDIKSVLALVSTQVAAIATLNTQLAAAIAANAPAPDLSAQIADIQAQTAALAAVLPAPVVTPAPAA